VLSAAVSGDIVAELRADSLEAFDRVLGRIRLTPGIGATETSLLLSTHRYERAFKKKVNADVLRSYSGMRAVLFSSSITA